MRVAVIMYQSLILVGNTCFDLFVLDHEGVIVLHFREFGRERVWTSSIFLHLSCPFQRQDFIFCQEIYFQLEKSDYRCCDFTPAFSRKVLIWVLL